MIGIEDKKYIFVANGAPLMSLRGLWGPVGAVLLPYLLFHFLSRSSWDASFAVPVGHFYMVSAVALLAVLIAIAAGVAGSRVRNIKVGFLALSFISLAMVFMVHGLSTPNLLLHVTHLPTVSAPLSVMLATFWLWLSSLPSDHAWIRFFARHEKRMVPVWTIALALVCTMGMLFPNMIDFIRLDLNPVNWSVTIVVALFNLGTMYRYYQSYQYSRFPLQISIVYSAGWLTVSQLIMIQGTLWNASWWLYHFVLLASMIAMLVGLYKQYAAKHSLTGALRALYTTDPVERVTSSISPSVKALMAATESKDKYTAGHNLRVTLYALKLSEEMHLRPDQLRAIAQGTIVHDVGKIDIPDAILNKPGRLTPEERNVIERHPVTGYNMCRTLGFMKEELEIIRSHHEKWNGEGYPDRLQNEQIPLMARIVAVADVYDALTSNRAYRQAMTHQAAMAFLDEQKGTHFDPACVEAWERACAKDPSIVQQTPEMPNAEPPGSSVVIA
jgi:putative nucleotidyltransferase with HDIG domain